MPPPGFGTQRVVHYKGRRPIRALLIFGFGCFVGAELASDYDRRHAEQQQSQISGASQLHLEDGLKASCAALRAGGAPFWMCDK